MTETERWVNGVCERLVASGSVRHYRDLYKDLRERLPCGVACRLIEAGLAHTRYVSSADGPYPSIQIIVARARAIAALRRLVRWAGPREWREWEQVAYGL